METKNKTPKLKKKPSTNKKTQEQLTYVLHWQPNTPQLSLRFKQLTNFLLIALRHLQRQQRDALVSLRRLRASH